MLGVLLVAIVGLRVEVLKLGSSVGRNIQLASTLQSGNQVLRSQVSELSGNQRIEGIAAGMGMVMPGPMDVHFVQSSTAEHVSRAISGIHAPDATSFLSGLATERAADTNNAVVAASTSAVGAQSTNDPGTVLDTSVGTSSNTTSSNQSSAVNAAATSNSAVSNTTSGASSAGSTPVSTAGGTSANPPTAGASGTAASTGTTEPSPSADSTSAGTGSTTGGTGLVG